MSKNKGLLLLVWNLVLTAAIVYLAFRLSGKPESVSHPPTPSANGEPELVFVNTDTLLEHYPYYNALNEAFKKKQDSLEGIMSSRASAIERDIKAYQESGAAMTPQQRQATEEKLYKRQQALMEFREQALGALGEEEESMMDQLHADLAREVREYNNGRYHFVFGYQRGSGILFADSTRDITKEMIAAVKDSGD